MDAETIKLRYLAELRDLWNLERRGATLLPRMARAASRPDLASTLRALAWVTLEQRRRLDKILEELGALPVRPEPSSGAGVFALVEEELRQGSTSDHLDVVLIGLAQRLAHLGQAAYGIAATLAEKLGYSHHASALQKSLEEDTEVDFRLIRIALFQLPVEDGCLPRQDGRDHAAPTRLSPPPPGETALDSAG